MLTTAWYGVPDPILILASACFTLVGATLCCGFPTIPLTAGAAAWDTACGAVTSRTTDVMRTGG